MAARGIEQPQFLLRFWRNELVFAYLDYKHRFTRGLDDDAHTATVRRTEDLLRNKIGQPDENGSDSNGTTYSWEWNGVSISFITSDDGTHPVGDVLLHMHHREKFGDAGNWRTDADNSRGSGPGVTFGCEHTEPVSGFLNIITETIDTRALSHREASKVAKRRAETAAPPGFKCDAKVRDHQVIDIVLNMTKNRQRYPYTYLRFRDQDGLIVSQKFQFAGPDTEDAVCENYRKRLPRKIRKTAECITGTELPVKPY